VTRVVIAGGGFAGLSAALFLARRGHVVTLIERDGPPPAGDVEDDAERWQRPGAPQSHQSHALLARARRVLTIEAPDVLAALLANGVRELPVVFGAGAVAGEFALLTRRLVAEATMRRIVTNEPGVEVRSGEAVVGVQVVRSGDVPVVNGVELLSGEVIHADLVVDAGGRRSALPMWCSDADLRLPTDQSQDCGFFYLTRYYRLRHGHEMPLTVIPGATVLDYANVLALGADNDTFSLTMTLSVDDPYRKAFRRPDRHEALLRRVPLVAPWIEAGEPTSDISMMARIENRRRRLVDHNGPIAAGIVAIGDAAIHTNPTLGRGISLAFAHAQQLADMAHEAPDDPVGFVERFDAWTNDHLGVWFDAQVAADAGAIDRMQAGVDGERLPLPDAPMARFMAAAFVCGRDDELVGTAMARMVHLLASPAEVMGDPVVTERVQRFLSTNPDLERAPDVPSRAEFEVIASS
jgi:2-polyprenyl-6-methoxyphenol hydroxylase-like FAD-dependent oxidoreductase